MDIFSIHFLVVATLLWQETWADDKTSCNCGWVNKGRIVGGKAAQKHQFPWMAALWGQDMVMCGATIITKRHAITASHCNHASVIHLVLVVGLHDIRNYRNNKDNDATTIEIDKIIDHPTYAPAQSFKDDISLVVTKTEIPFSTNVGPACFPTAPINLDHKDVLAIGWGRDKRTVHPPFMLQHLNLTIMPHQNCKQYWGRNLQEPPTQLCGVQSVYGVCYGDSGGPLVWLDPDTKRYTLVGIPSFVRKNCIFPPPSVFTEVAKYVSWIKETIKENAPEEVCSKI